MAFEKKGDFMDMTNERAIQIIRNEIKCMIRKARRCSEKCDTCNVSTSMNEKIAAYDLAIKVLEKADKT